MARIQAGGQTGLHLFDTNQGPCGLAWTGRGIDRVCLPDRDRAAAEARLRGLTPDRDPVSRPPGSILNATRRMVRHLAGKPDPLQDVVVDLSGTTDFHRRVYRALRRVQPGKTVTYGALARKAGRPGAARAVGRAMALNPVPLLVPCHRVVTSNQKLGGFSAPGGVTVKAKLLFDEGVILNPRHALGVEHLKRNDPKLRPVIQRVGPYLPGLGEAGDPYGALVEAVLHQQLSMKAAATIAGRVRALTPGPRFPRPEEIPGIPDTRFRAAGLSKQKIAYLRDLAARVMDRTLPLGRLRYLDDEAVTELITRVKGFGRWSAQMFLLFHLGRLDVLPVDDLGLRKGFQEAYGTRELPGAETLVRMTEKWQPYRSMGTWYLWQAQNAGGM